MNAIEYVKHHGIEYAKSIIIGCESGLLPKNNNYADLKQIVDAWELVEKFGGLNESRKYVDNRILPELSRAINLVEQCK